MYFECYLAPQAGGLVAQIVFFELIVASHKSKDPQRLGISHVILVLFVVGSPPTILLDAKLEIDILFKLNAFNSCFFMM